MISAIIFGDHLLRIIFSSDSRFEVNNAVMFIGSSYPFVSRKADLLSVATVIETARTRKQSCKINFQAALASNRDVGSVSLNKFFGSRKLAHRTDGIVYARVNDIVNAVQNDNSFRAYCGIKGMLEAFNSRFSPMLLDTNLIFAKHAVSADTSANYRAVVDPKLGQASGKAIGPRLSGNGISKCNDGGTIFSCEIIYRMKEYVRSAVAYGKPRDIIGTCIVALRIIFGNIMTAVPMAATKLSFFLYI